MSLQRNTAEFAKAGYLRREMRRGRVVVELQLADSGDSAVWLGQVLVLSKENFKSPWRFQLSPRHFGRIYRFKGDQGPSRCISQHKRALDG